MLDARLAYVRRLELMTTESSFVAHVVDQVGLVDRFVSHKMFGEYGFHVDGKFVALACENSFFIKETAALAQHRLDLPFRPPYPGAKPYPVADELLDDPDLLRQVVLDSAACLPEPKPKSATKRKARKN
jgi:TfoX/Sxy family transcriptional regulator of competence genes